jgi:hypothetical protein
MDTQQLQLNVAGQLLDVAYFQLLGCAVLRSTAVPVSKSSSDVLLLSCRHMPWQMMPARFSQG